MRRLLSPSIAALCLTGMLWAPAARAENQGQADLDKATQLKMSAAGLGDLSEVIRLTESAMEKGLDKGNRAFAQSLLASALIQRGTDTAAAIFHGGSLDSNVSLDSNWSEYRKLALADLERGVALEAKQPQAMLLIAKLNLELPGGDAKRAGQALDEAVKLSGNEGPVRVDALVLRAAVRKDLKDKAADLDEAARLAPKRAAIFRSRAAVRDAQDKLDAALEDLDRALALEPKHVPSYQAKALVLAKMKRYEEALAVLDKAVALAPDAAASSLVEKARIYMVQKKMQAALEALDKADAAAPDNPLVLFLRGGVQLELGHNERALADLDRVLQRQPDAPEALRLRGNVLLTVGRRGEAIADFDKVLAQEPKDVTVLNNLAWLLATAPEDTLRDGKRAVTLAALACQLTDYKQDYILSTMAAACAEAGDFDNARKWAAKAVQLGGTNKEHGASLKKELASYQAGKPWREALPEPEEKAPPKPEEKKGP